MKKRSTKVVLGGLIGIGVLFLTLAVVPAAAAATVKHARPVTAPKMHANIKKPNLGGIFGTITSISGNTLTVQGKNNSSTVYTVDATGAKVVINGQASSLSGLAVGNQIAVRGKSTGTNQISAQSIMKGMPPIVKGAPRLNGIMHGGAVVGSITAISGNSLTVQGKNGTVYTVDATSAAVKVNGQASTLSALAVGDQISARGTQNGTNQITAQTISKGTMGKGFGAGGARGFGR